jgi:hypothetical protein
MEFSNSFHSIAPIRQAKSVEAAISEFLAVKFINWT